MSEIVSATPGRLRVLVIDVTRNRKQFEHAVTRTVFWSLKGCGVALATEDPVLVGDIKDISSAFEAADGKFNTVLLIAHGGPDPGGGMASEVDLAGEVVHWYLAGSLFPGIKDNLVCLAVCHGSCHDAVQSLTNGDNFAMTLVAPKTTLSLLEVCTFFPTFFDDLNRSTTSSIPADVVERCVNDNNHLAKGKMCVNSAGKTVPVS